MSEARRWVRTARCEDIPLREGRAVRFGSREIAIFNLGDRFLAISNRCPHRNGPLADGIVSGTAVVCPLHAWKVDLATGAVARPADSHTCAETFRVRVEAGVLLVEIPDESSARLEVRGLCLDHGGLPPVLEPSHLLLEDPETGSVGA